VASTLLALPPAQVHQRDWPLRCGRTRLAVASTV